MDEADDGQEEAYYSMVSGSIRSFKQTRKEEDDGTGKAGQLVRVASNSVVSWTPAGTSLAFLQRLLALPTMLTIFRVPFALSLLCVLKLPCTTGDYLESRQFQGLEQQLGETPVSMAVPGRTGVARGYSNEPGASA